MILVAFKDDFRKYNNKSLTYVIFRDNNAKETYTGPLTLTNNGLEIPIFHDFISIDALILTETPDSKSELFQITVSRKDDFVLEITKIIAYK